MDNEKILDKVQKLLQLATSNNVHESALAASAAQRLMHKYNLTMLMVESYDGQKPSPEKIIDFTRVGEPLDFLGRNISSWKCRLAMIISKANHCRVYINIDPNGNRCIGLVGTERDATITRYLYAYLTLEIDRLTLRDGTGKGKTWCNNFRLGAIFEIELRLKEALEQSKTTLKEECRKNNIDSIHTNNALVKFSEKDLAVEEFIKQLSLKGGHTINTKNILPSALTAGRKAAREIDLGNDNKRLDPKHHQLEGNQ